MIDVDALRTGLDNEQRELQEAITRDETKLRRGPDEQLSAAIELRRSQLRRVRRALDRHEQGTWRQCEDCDTTISDAQVKAVPTATHCTDCAEQQVFWGDTTVVRRDALGLG